MTRKRPASPKQSAGVPLKAVEHAGLGHVEEVPPGQERLAEPEVVSDAGPAAGLSTVAGLSTAGVILIEIDPGVSGGYVNNRFDVTIRGRAVSASPIEEIRLQVGDLVSSAASYGLPERAAVGTMPDGTSARQRAFQFNLSRPADGQVDRCIFQIVARTEDGFEHAETYEIEIDATAGEPVTLLSGPARPAASFGTVRPFSVMYIERATIDADGMLAVQGWAVALTPVLAIQIYADSDRISKARQGQERDDVAAVFPAYPGSRLSGFSLTIQLAEVDRDASTIRAQLVCANGFGHDETIPIERLQRRAVVKPSPEPVAAPGGFTLFDQRPTYQLKTEFRMTGDATFGLVLPEKNAVSATAVREGEMLILPVAGPDARVEPSVAIEMFCDAAELTGDGFLTLTGWAVCGIGVGQVRVLLDEVEVGLATFGHERPDVGSTFADIPMARFAGFRFHQNIGKSFDGEHDVRVVVRNIRDAENDKVLTVTAVPVVVVAEPEPTPVVTGAPALTAAQSAEFKFELDAPGIVDGIAVELVTGRLTIDGWLLTRSGIERFEVFLDDQRLGDAHYGLARQDVGSAFPDWPNSLRSGYAFHCPPRSLRDGEHTVTLKIRANNGQEINRSFQITVKKAEDQQDAGSIRRRVPLVEADMMCGFLAAMAYRPEFRVIIRQHGPVDVVRLRATLEALRSQAYPDWSVAVLANDPDSACDMRAVIDQSDPAFAGRYRVISPEDAEAWNTPLAQAEAGLLYAVLLPGDEPGADALLELAVAAGRNQDSGVVYADEVRISPVSNEKEPFFKPDFSPDLLYSTNYIGRPWVANGLVLTATGATPASLLTDGDYDLVLRCTEAAGVHHVAKLLCQRAAVALDDAVQERAALERMMDRRGIVGEVLPAAVPGTWRIRRSVASKGKVSIIIPTCAAQGYIETCLNTLRAKTAYRNYEIIVIDNIPHAEMAWKVWLQKNADKTVEIPGAFNWSIFNNRATEVAEGEFLLFLNDDIEITQDDWLDVLMESAQRPEVGIVGPQLLYRDGKVQHAGMFLANNGIGRHAFRFAASDDPCYFGLALTQRNVMAVTGACMLVRKETFDRLGRFNEAHEIVNNDLDFCLRVHKAGLLTVFTPYASLIHYELASRANLKDVFDLTHFNAAWKTTFAAGDPYFNLRLSRHADDYRPDDEPVQWIVSGSPMFRSSEIKSILVVKLDHIGDFVTALPPIRRLRKLFPQARITVLAGPASRAFVSLEPCIDEFIPFAFFHARSQLGERGLTQQDFAELGEMLKPYRFDLAIDLRKHLSTRDVLKHTGARFLAGFDYLGQFPFLDIALDWDGDRTLQRKRSHIVDDLMALVNAVGHAAEEDRTIMQPGPVAMDLQELPLAVQALFVKPVVAIHPGAGNVTKQWPEEHFSALIDLLVEKNGVNIMLVGGPDEVEVADRLLANVLHTEAIASMAGLTPLKDLPRLLKNCALYIGNDSGPKHIAAAVGIPTIGIHSGVVDPVEWGPIGPNAVALRRNMTCSPCYLAKAEDCPRSLACLRLFEPNSVWETADLLLRRAPVVDAIPVTDVVPTPVRRSKVGRRQRATEAV